MTRIWALLLLCAAAVSLLDQGARASVLTRPPQEGKAVYLLGDCGARMLAPGGVGTIAEADGARWIVEQRGENTLSLRAFGGRAWLGVRNGGVHISADLAPEERAWTWQDEGEGRFRLRPALLGQRALALGPDGAVLTPPGGCETLFSFDQFPVHSPGRRTLHVDGEAGGGRSGEDGSAGAPFRSINAAVRSARPGDRILVHPGEYREAVAFPKALSGKPQAWVVIESAITHAAKVIPPPGAAGFELLGDFVEVHGFEVVNPGDEPCIKIDWGSSHQRVMENFAHDCGGGGVTVARSDHTWIEGNVVARTSFRNPYVMSGISIWQPRAADRAPGPHIVIRRNISYGNENRVPGKKATDGNGVIIDDTRNKQMGSKAGPFLFPTLIEDNLVFANGGSGVRVLLSDNVTIRRNTSYMNLHRQEDTTWRGEIMNVLSADTLFENNLAVANTDFHPQNYALFDSAREVKGRWRGNLAYSWPMEGRTFRQISTAAGPPEGNLLGVRPEFANPRLDALADFRMVGQAGASAGVGARMELLPELR